MANIAIFAPISNTPRIYPLYIPLINTITTGSVLLDQLVTIDYNARRFEYIESVSPAVIQVLLQKVVLIFQLNSYGYHPEI